MIMSNETSRETSEDLYAGFNSELREKYDDMLDEVCLQYSLICAEDNNQEFVGEIRRFQFEGLLRNSPFKDGVVSAKTLLYFQKLIHQFAKTWDQLVNKDTGRDGSHIYFLTYITDYKDTKVIAKEFNRFGKTDRKLIAITIPENTRRINYLPFLHEMGHFIGGRNREERKKILIDLTVLCFLRQVYNHCVAHFHGVSPNTPIKAHNGLNTTLDLQEDAFCTHIILNLKPIYEDLKSNIQQISNRTRWKKQEDGFSKDFVGWIVECLVKNLARCGLWDAKIDEIKANGYHGKEYEVEILRKSGKEVLALFDADEVSSIACLIDSFEEPIADSFMVRVGGIGFRQYLSIILSQTWARWDKIKNEEGSKEEYKEYVAAEVSRIRILSICHAMEAKEKDICSILDRINVFTRKGRCNYAVRIMLREMNKKQNDICDWEDKLNDLERKIEHTVSEDERSLMQAEAISIGNELFKQDLLNPQRIISDYIKRKVISHSRYKKIEEPQLKTLTDELRIYKLKWAPLIDARLWLYHKIHGTSIQSEFSQSEQE